MHQVRFCACALLLLVCAVPAIAANQRDIQAKVFFDTKTQFFELRQMPLDVIKSADTYFELFADSSELAGLTAAGYRTEIVYPSVEAHYRPRLARTPGTLDMGGWKTLAEINARLDSLIAANPTLLSAKQSIGNTIEGRPMWVVKLSDNPNVDEDEPEIFFTAAIHAREVITPEVLFYFMDHLLTNYGVDADITNLVNSREIWFLLNVNPDGYYYNQVIAPTGLGMWRKNRRENADLSYGVDLNRNFGYHWGWDNAGSSPTPANETYRGTAAFSEPETQHVRDFMTAHNFSVAMNFHSYSNLVLYPWGYDQLLTPDNDIFSQMADSCAAFNGYTPIPGWGLYVTNGDSDDWEYGEQTTKNKVFAMTIEVGSDGDGFWPALSRKAQLVSENLQPCLISDQSRRQPV